MALVYFFGILALTNIGIMILCVPYNMWALAVCSLASLVFNVVHAIYFLNQHKKKHK
jgi:hypothetical protein